MTKNANDSSMPGDRQLIVADTDAGLRLDVFLAREIPDLTRSGIKKMIQRGDVQVNSELPTVHYFLKSGDRIACAVSSDRRLPTSTLPLEPLPAISIIAETNDYIILDKPVGLLVHPISGRRATTLIDWLVAHDPAIAKVGEDPGRPGIVHRLDKDVSGLMVIARTQDMFDHLKTQFKTRQIAKHYTALVHGVVIDDSDDIRLPIGRSKSHRGLYAARPAGQEQADDRHAWTHITVQERFTKYTLLDVEILTGRTHQIRVHLKSYGHPIVGDPLYGLKDDRSGAPRLFLHASSLEFTDLTGEHVSFASPLPGNLERFLVSIDK